MRSRLPTQWQARVASYQHHRSQTTDKPEPTSDAQECAGRLEHTYGSSPGQRLKSPANQDIAESEWHEPIHNIPRKAIQRHTPCHKGLGSCIQVLASHLHHLSWFQDVWPGQRHASKQRTSIYSMVQVSSSRTVCDGMWTRPDFSPMPRNWLFSTETWEVSTRPDNRTSKDPIATTRRPIKVKTQVTR